MSSRLEKFIHTTAIAFSILYAFSSTYFFKALFADGAFFFFDSLIRIASQLPDWWSDDSKHIRLFVNILNQLPLKLAYDVGVRDIEVLRWIFNAPLYFSNLLILAWVYVVALRGQDRTMFAFALAVHVLFIVPSDVFGQNPARLSMAVYWLIFCYLTIPVRLGVFDKAALLALSVLVFRSHEGILLCGPIMFMVAILNWWRGGLNLKFRLFVASLNLAAGIYALFWQFTHPVATQTAGYLTTILNFSRRDLSQTMFGFVWLAILLILFYGIRLRKLRDTNIVFLITLAGLVFYGVCPVVAPRFVQPAKEFDFRVYITVGGFGAMLVAFCMVATRSLARVQIRIVLVILATTYIGEVIWQSSSLWQWQKMVQATRVFTTQSTHPVEDSRQVINFIVKNYSETPAKFDWGWAWPYYGFTLAEASDRPKITTVIFYPQLADMLKQKLRLAKDGYFDFSELRKRCSRPDSDCKQIGLD